MCYLITVTRIIIIFPDKEDYKRRNCVMIHHDTKLQEREREKKTVVWKHDQSRKSIREYFPGRPLRLCNNLFFFLFFFFLDESEKV